MTGYFPQAYGPTLMPPNQPAPNYPYFLPGHQPFLNQNPIINPNGAPMAPPNGPNAPNAQNQGVDGAAAAVAIGVANLNLGPGENKPKNQSNT